MEKCEIFGDSSSTDSIVQAWYKHESAWTSHESKVRFIPFTRVPFHRFVTVAC